jgi:hypothetical protein
MSDVAGHRPHLADNLDVSRSWQIGHGHSMIGRLWDLPDKPAARFVFGVAGLALITLAARLLHLQPGGILFI